MMAFSAPMRRQASHFFSLPAVAIARAPKARASMMAVEPMPQQCLLRRNRILGVAAAGKER